MPDCRTLSDTYRCSASKENAILTTHAGNYWCVLFPRPAKSVGCNGRSVAAIVDMIGANQPSGRFHLQRLVRPWGCHHSFVISEIERERHMGICETLTGF